jgi:transposase-like protein
MDQIDVATLTTAFLILFFFVRARQLWSLGHEQWSEKKPRRLRPRTPEDCPYCGKEHEKHCHPVVRLRQQPVPNKERKSRRGRSKEKQTEGYCCWNLGCEYYGIRNAAVHAIVGDGHHGKGEAIQDYRCQWCGCRVSERKGTVMYCLKTATAKVEMVLKGLGEGVDLSAAERIFGHSGETVRRWLTRAGMHSEGVHEQFMVDMKSEHVQLDELKVNMKGVKNQWLWVAIAAKSKVLLSLQVGPRKQWVAHALVHSVVGMMAPGYVPLYTSDGLAMYFYALTAHYGSYQEMEGKRKPHWVVSEFLQYAQMKKHRVWRKLKRIEIRVLCGEREAIKERLLSMGLRATVQTSFVERVNLTLRQSIAGLARRTWSQNVMASELEIHLSWYQAYYHFCRGHQSLRTEYTVTNPAGVLLQRYRKRTPAMAAGWTRHCWSVSELILYPLPPAMA